MLARFRSSPGLTSFQEVAYYKEHRMEMVLTNLHTDKLLNKREAGRELKHLHNLMADRDVWLQDKEVAAAKERMAEVKKANTKKGRLLTKRAIEKEETERLAKEGPPLTGLPLFAKLRRDRQAAAEQKESEVATESAVANTKVKKTKPLSQVLARQSTADPNADTTASDVDTVSRNNSTSSIDHHRSRNRKGCSVGFSALSDTFDEVNVDDSSQPNLPEDSFAKPAPKVESKSYTIMKELYRFTTAHSAEVLKLHDKQSAQLKVK